MTRELGGFWAGYVGFVVRVRRSTGTNADRKIYGDYGMQLFHVFIEFCDNREPEALWDDAVR